MTLIPLLTLAVGCAEQDNATVDAIFATWDEPGSPGCALALAQDGKLIYSRGYGYANLDHDIPNTPLTVFDVASITKQFVAASLGMLELDGKLSLDDNVRKWLPELPEYESPITLRHLLNHTSGLRDYLTLFPLAGRDDYFPLSHAQILAMMARQRALISPPGDEYRYSNTGYMLLSQVVERVSGKSLGEFTRERIFEPLGMDHSLMYENLEVIIPRRATGYISEEDGKVRIVHNYNFDVAGDGQLYSTMEDLLRWDNYLHGAVQPPIYPLMLTERYLDSGEPIEDAQGIRRIEYRGLQTVGHSGTSWGFRTELVRFVEAGLSIAISCNTGSVSPYDLARQVADLYLAEQLGPMSSEIVSGGDEQIEAKGELSPALTLDQLGEFAGSYHSAELDASYRFAVENAELVLRIEQEPRVVVVAVADDRFEFIFDPAGRWDPEFAVLEFDRNRRGLVIGFGLSMGAVSGIVFETGEGR